MFFSLSFSLSRFRISWKEVKKNRTRTVWTVWERRSIVSWFWVIFCVFTELVVRNFLSSGNCQATDFYELNKTHKQTTTPAPSNYTLQKPQSSVSNLPKPKLRRKVGGTSSNQPTNQPITIPETPTTKVLPLRGLIKSTSDSPQVDFKKLSHQAPDQR